MHEGTDKQGATRDGTTRAARSSPAASKPARSVVDGRFVLERALSKGAMSIVASAEQVHSREPVALKFLNPEHVRDPVMSARFDREAAALWKSQSAHVVRMIGVGNAKSVGPYIAMERLEGKDLAQLVAEGPLGPERAITYVIQACRALAVAHAAGVVHHDVKPENLLLAHGGEDETVKLIDFGICEDAAHPAPPGGDWIIGTPAYMSPERIMGTAPHDPRSDIWSLGITLYELATGQLPFVAASDADLCRNIAAGTAPKLNTNARLMPRGLKDVVARCLQADPARRYQQVDELLAVLCEPSPSSRRLRGHVTGKFRRSLLGRYGAQLRERASQRTKK